MALAGTQPNNKVEEKQNDVAGQSDTETLRD
jgi:hypothetical protein